MLANPLPRTDCYVYLSMQNNQSYLERITIDPSRRSGKPCVKGTRITVYDILGWLGAGRSHAEIIDDFPELSEQDILAVLQFAADRENKIMRKAS